MTAAGSATVAWTPEDNYGDGPGADPTWRQPGLDIVVGDLTAEQALERVRGPDDPTPLTSRAGNFEGGLSVEFTLTDDHFHELVFADGGTALPSGPMLAPSATWYLAVELPDGTTEPRTPAGAIVTDASIVYQQGSDIRVELTFVYGDEPTSIDAPAAIEKPDKEQVYSWHGTTLDVDGVGQSILQSATLSLSGLGRLRRGQSRHPVDAVVDAIDPSLSTDAMFTKRDQLAAAVDDASDYQVGDGRPGTLSFENGLGETIGYNLEGLQPTSYAWSDLVAADTDLAEPIEYHVSDVGVSA